MTIQEATELVYQQLYRKPLGDGYVKIIHNVIDSPSFWEWEIYRYGYERGIRYDLDCFQERVLGTHYFGVDAENYDLERITDITESQLKIAIHKWIDSTDRWLGGEGY